MFKDPKRLMLSTYIVVQMLTIAMLYSFCINTCKNSKLLVVVGFTALTAVAWIGLTFTVYYFKNHTHNHTPR